MLEDRDYMRQPDYGPKISFTVALLIVNAIVFVIQCVAERMGATGIEHTYFALSLDGLRSGYVWQLLTFQFMHVSVMHILFNSLAIYFFGRSVETAIGGKHFLILYFSSGVIGGIVQMLLNLARSDGGWVMGASAGGAGLIGAFSLLAWDERFTLFLYFLPITMRGRTLLWVSAGLFLVGVLTPNDHVANAAHLGGLVAGFFYVRQIVQGRWQMPQFHLPQRHAPPRELAVKRANQKSSWNPKNIPADEDLTADEYLQKEVDPILDKISASGIQSLTAREREILEKARARMNRR